MVVLCGPKGAGKTHLARAWAERSGAIALNPEDLGSDPNPSPEQLTFLIEDIGGEPFDETALFHLANSVRQRGGSMLLTSSSLPSAWRLDLPDLKSRLLSATAIEIGEPDDALLLAVLGKLFADRQVIVEANVSAYLVTRMERSLCEAVRIAGLLDAVALEKKARITRALAASIFADGDPRQGDLGL